MLPLSIVTAVFEGTNQAISALLGLQKNELAASTELLNAQANFLNALKAYREVEEDVLGEETEEEVDQKEEDTV
ncbi:hypothetical protein AIOL_004486 [Candidatus Rhodobacter oscarellae]|uniref:Uncharacterized protein n=1 Tax=Candidatus Rhodobacter oscarellae TaxID=1675527 RepID=A0A0J9ECQ3_9RHOB|nr:hypothetical protein AIOL_004486 [Candidatus Rhodobacter lobularis]